MLFHSSIRKEMARAFGATVVVLATIVMTMFLIRTVGLASRGSVNPAEVMMVLGYTVLGQSPAILTLSLFISIVGTLSRMYRDSEMVIWFSSGRGLASFVRPLIRFVWPVLVVIAVTAVFAWPWAHEQSQSLRDRFEQRSDLERVAPGQFQESASGTRVFFIDKDSVEGKTAGEVFIAASEKGQETVTSARAGRIETTGSDRFLLLSNGQRLEKAAGNQGLKLSEFEQYGLLITDRAREAAREISPQAVTTQTLIAARTPAFLGELSWRLGMALAAINLVLIGLALSSVNPRIGRNGNLVFSLFTFILYYNMINLGSSRIATGSIDFGRFMLMLHGGVFITAMLLLAKLHWNWTLSASLRRHRAGMSAAGTAR